MRVEDGVIDYPQAGRTMAFDIEKKCWSEELLRAAGALEGLKDTNQVSLTELMGDPGGAQTSLL